MKEDCQMAWTIEEEDKDEDSKIKLKASRIEFAIWCNKVVEEIKQKKN